MVLLQLHLQAGQVLLDPIEIHAQLLPLDSALLGGHALRQRETGSPVEAHSAAEAHRPAAGEAGPVNTHQLLKLQIQLLYLPVKIVLQGGLEPDHQGLKQRKSRPGYPPAPGSV